MKQELLNKIENRSARVGVVGLGYVGLPLAVEKARAGFITSGIDVSDKKVAKVNAGENYIGDVDDALLKKLVEDGKLSATSDFSKVAELDFIVICVPTPLDVHQQPDISYIQTSAESIGDHLTKGSLVVLESTTYPGTTEGLVRPILEERSGLVCGKDFYLAYSPERVDPGNKNYKTNNTPKVVGGVTQDCTDVAEALYRTTLDSEIYPVSSPSVAEMEKILENTYRFVNIGLANEMAVICHRMGINVWEVIDAAKTKPYGFHAFYPGPGLGGHCIPLDPYYLTWKAREYDYHTKLIETAGEVNSMMPEFVVDRAFHILNDKKKAINGSKVLLLGVAYKKDIDDLRMSPALRVLEILESFHADVSYYDAYNPQFTAYDGTLRRSMPELSAEDIASYDLIIVTTDHTNVDYAFVAEHAQQVFDTRNVLKEIEGAHIFRL
ncbi:MAG: nucleotide sugar dehydrogenase [Tissierellia bacterium]|nr:nucleotide sugar dehydrogenase [Bacillota bacterium]NLK58453.1 nucleotide sugar dehydrogenase [Tissierellia bacterium]